MNGAWPHHPADLGLRYASAAEPPPPPQRDQATAMVRVGQAPTASQPQAQPTTAGPKTYPWYFWVGATVAVAGAGYLLWRYLRGGSPRRRDPDASSLRFASASASPAPERMGESPDDFEPLTLRSYVERGPSSLPGGGSSAGDQERYVLTRVR